MESLGAHQTLGQICVRKGYLTQEQVEMVMRTHLYRKIRLEDMEIGRLAVQKDYVNSDQVLACLQIQEIAYKQGRASIPRLVHILGDRGLINGRKAVELLEAVHAVDRGGKAKISSDAEEKWALDPSAHRRRELRRLIPRESERFGVPDAYLRYRTGLLDSLRETEEEMSPLIDLSLTGLQFLTRKKLKIGQKLRMELIVPAFDDKLAIKGEVRWIGRAGLTELYRTGVHFTGLDQQIADYLEKLEEDPFLRSMGRSPFRVYR
jgi:hypothetical protein